MKYKSIPFLLFLILSLFSSITLAEEAVVISTENFESIVGKSEYAVVEFYTPWCGHCKKLEPEYEKAAVALKQSHPNILVGKCESTLEENKALASRYGIRGFPTLKMFVNGSLDNPIDYKGPRDADGIVKYLVKAFGPPSPLFEEADKLQALIKDLAPVIYGAFKSEDDIEFKTYVKAADSRRDLTEFAHSLGKNLIKGHENDIPGIFVFNSAEADPVKYTGDLTKEDEIGAWIENKALPELPELDQKNMVMMNAVSKLLGNDKPKVLGFALPDYDKLREFKEILKEINDENPNLNVIYVDGVKNQQPQTFFDIEKGDYPAIVIHHSTSNVKYVEKKVEPGQKMKDWIKAFNDGTLKPFLKTEEPPEENDEPVKVIVGKNLKEWLGKGKDIFLEFYAPWCKHCKNLAPDYLDLAKHFGDNENVIIAKFDATANDASDERFDVKGFPTLFYYKSKDDEVTKYEGGRDLDSLIKFVEKQLGIEREEEEEEEKEEEEEEEEKEEIEKEEEKEIEKEEKEEIEKEEKKEIEKEEKTKDSDEEIEKEREKDEKDEKEVEVERKEEL